MTRILIIIPSHNEKNKIASTLGKVSYREVLSWFKRIGIRGREIALRD